MSPSQLAYECKLGSMTLVAKGDTLSGVYLAGQKHHPMLPETDAPPAPILSAAARQLDAYFAGRRRVFELPLAPQGTPFQMRVWARLLEIPFGETATYGALAHSLGQPAAMRAVGAAVGRNPIGIIVPCHRVIGADGSLTGYAGGLAAKRSLLMLEIPELPLGR